MGEDEGGAVIDWNSTSETEDPATAARRNQAYRIAKEELLARVNAEFAREFYKNLAKAWGGMRAGR